MIGQTLGHYRVLEKIGEGGMGEVYKARDTRLDRTVALKVLTPGLACDADRQARFEREAKAISQLNHPHICTVFDVGQALPSGPGELAPGAQLLASGAPSPAPVHYLVMEYLEGETLATRLERGPLPFANALELGAQIADALDAAHRHGIIHRDLKPGNVMLTSSGTGRSGVATAKLLDFGLAKLAAHGERPVFEGSASAPTAAVPATAEGTILGTLPYMAPEQLEGRSVDARTDLWALGAMVYEMLAGRRAFEGESQPSLVGQIMNAEPPALALLQPLTPPAIDRVIRKCLAKHPDGRWDSARDVADELRWIAQTGPVSASASRPTRPREKVLLVALAASVLGLAVQTAMTLSGVWPRSNIGPTLRLRVSSMHPAGNEVGEPALSPDGRRLAYRARGADGVPRIWVRDLEDGSLHDLPGSEEGFGPFWAPNSQEVGFGTQDGLRRTSALGGPIERVTRGPANGASWGAGGTIVFASGSLFRVSATGGEPVPLLVRFDEDWVFLSPSFLPDGRRFLFTAKQWTESAESSRQGIYLGSLDSTEPQRLLPDLSSAVYAPPGYLLFVREGQLTAAPFDVSTGRLGSGRPVVLPEAVAVDPSYYVAGISASGNGTVAIRPPPVWPMRRLDGAFRSELRVVRRDGTAETTAGGVHYYKYRMALEASGRSAVAASADPRSGLSTLWLVDLYAGTRRPMGRAAEWNGSPAWSPDGTRVAYACQPKGGLDDLCVHGFSTGEIVTLSTTRSVWESPLAWSRDGEWLLFLRSDDFGVGLPGLYAYALRSGQAREVVHEVHGATGASFSPDSRFVAYTKLTSGRREVYVADFPQGRQETQVTTDGGTVLSWGEREGRGELLVASLSTDIVAYPVSAAGAAVRVGKPSVLLRNVGSDAVYARATPDHSRILIRVNPEAQNDKGEIALLFGWAERLKAGVPPRQLPSDNRGPGR